MKKVMLCIVVLALFPIGMLLAQSSDITGTWQGTIKIPGRDLRTVIKIAKADKGGLKAVMYSIDQGGQGIGASSITQEGPAVKMSVSTINGTYEGKLTPDGNLIEGTWTQGTASFPLVLDRATNDTAWTIPSPPTPMADFAGLLRSAVLDRPVVDQTGLTGRFDFELKWTPDESQFAGLGVHVPAPVDNPDAPPDLFTAIQEQLGLRLESTKAPVDVLVIDRAEKPSAN